MARLSERRGLYERAQKLYRGIIERDPKMGFAYHRLGVLAAKAQNFADAERYFKQALRLGSQNRAELLSDLGYCYYLDNRLEEAERTLSEALKQRPTDKKTCNNLALAIGAQGRFGECLSLFRRIGSEAEAHANLAYVLAQHGRFKEAEAAYLQALTLDTSLRPAGEALVQLVAHKRGIELADLEAQAPGPPRKQPAAPSAGGEGVHPGTENASHHSTAAAAGPNHPSTATGDARRLPGTREAAGDRPRTSPSAKQREILGDVQSPSRPTRRVVLPAQPSGPSGGRAADVPTWEHRPPRQRFPAQPVPAAHRWPPGKEATNAAAVNPAAYTYQPIGVRSPIVPRATEAPSGALPSPSASPRPQGP